MTRLLINLAQKVPMSDAALRGLAGNGRTKVRFEIADRASGPEPKPGDMCGLYHLEHTDDGLKVILNARVVDMPSMLRIGGATEETFKDPDFQAEHLRRLGVNTLHVTAHAVHAAGLGPGL